ncbi:hypothetical protein O6H91_12G072700 [Diphasiastrum complanatum]|uniref:Uncharacterized protein n=8 Tax=Diphasiastrum complanatum TaxID=34168 RepID=A0ACC2C3C9_DIPCM|nr:hypothetical protein O6H91_12G072700 [Diphasiastrum complanatum]KAJ7536522.1 hypothetical protein O6H91_12G072700 [Diphasiastrum complanatum]KAJ7536523.1 hypothetical protein O6H91_12G072700 [Diphasiastrum complanatum]KAJ7536524.1 hypothetical protein O6H91_12G072700 [Diphasiastrum complanatum]KAJ7536525.1 hypothetical protein O6H91_12G072700 [Diphasiastrum complanatum]
MGSSGPPGNFDIQNFFKTSTAPSVPPYSHPSASYPLPSHGYHPSSHPFPPNSFSTTGSYSSSSFSAVPGSTFSFPQGPLYQSYMHYPQDPRPASYPSTPFVQGAPFSQPLPTVQQSTAPQVHIRSPSSSPPLDGARLMALLTTQSSADSILKEESSATVLSSTSSLELPPPALSSIDISLGNPEASRPPPAIAPALPTAPPVSLAPSTLSTRLSSRKIPKGRFLSGEHVIYDIDVRLPGEAQPQLEVSPITVYGSDPVLLVGRQIAVNRNYICYGLKNATIRVLSMHADLKLLVRGHSQRVTDMAFFSDDVHVLASASADGTVFVNKIVETYSDDGKGQLKGQIIVAIRFLGDWESAHPRVCWHSQTQDYLIVAIGKYVMTVNVGKVRMAAPSGGFTVEDPLKCSIDNPIEGVHLVGAHDAEVTDLSTISLMTSRLASSSKDATVCIWGEAKMLSQALFIPHEGHPVGFVSFLSAPRRPDHVVLLTAGPLNRELKMWVPTGPEGSLFTVAGKWHCIQSLEFKSSLESKHEQAFFNQVLVVPHASLILLANAKRNALYAVHVQFGSTPAATRMDYLSEYSVTMPILSLTALCENVSDGEGTIRVYCVQTQAIQQYALDLSQCLPPVQEVSGEGSASFDKGLGPKVLKLSGSSEFSGTDGSQVSSSPSNVGSLRGPLPAPGLGGPRSNFDKSVVGNVFQPFGSSLDVSVSADQVTDIKTDLKVASTLPVKELKEFVKKEDSVNSSDRASFFNSEMATSTFSKALPSTKRSRSKSPPKLSHDNSIQVPASSSSGNKADKPSLQEHTVNIRGDLILNNSSEATEGDFGPPHSDNEEIESGEKSEENEGQITPSSSGPPHLITPSELMSMVARSKAEADISSMSLPSSLGIGKDAIVADLEQESTSEEKVLVSDTKPVKADRNTLTESNLEHSKETSAEKLESLDNISVMSEAITGMQAGGDFESSKKERMANVVSFVELSSQDAALNEGIQNEEVELLEDREKHLRVSTAEEPLEQRKDVAVKASDSNSGSGPSPTGAKARKSKTKTNLVPGVTTQLSSLQVPVTSVATTVTTFEGESSSSNELLSEGLAAQLSVMQNSLTQLLTMQKEFQKQMAAMAPVAKEGKRIEASLGQRLEKVLKANVDVLWARIQEENIKRDKLERERVHQLTTLLSNSINKDLPSALERVLKKELALVGPPLAKSITPSIEKTISSTVADVLQKGLSEKTLPQLEKMITGKLEAFVAKHLQTQFQTSGRQALQDAMWSCFEGSVIPAFEKSCKVMFEQVDTAFQRGMAEHTSHAQQQFATSHTALASTLQDTVASASSLAASLKGELADGQRKLVALAENAGSNAPRFPIASKPTNGNLPDKVLSLQHLEESLDPTIEIARLVAARKLEEAFNRALSLSDVAVVSWLCNQVDPVTLFATNPLPLSQGVVLSLVQQLGCDLGKDTARKLTWIREAALRLNPNDPVLAPHMRLFLDQLYNNLRRQLLLLPPTGELTSSLTLVIHVVNSLLTACK